MTTWQIEFDNQFASLTPTKQPLTVEAEYYQRSTDPSDPWVTFKDEANKVVYDAALRGIASIQKVQLTGNGTDRTVKLTLNANVDAYIESMKKDKAATEALNKARKEGGA
jgi:hypothetical protein